MKLHALAEQVRKYFAMTLTRPVRHELSEPGEALLEAVEALPADEVVVSRATVFRCIAVLGDELAGSAERAEAMGELNDALIKETS